VFSIGVIAGVPQPIAARPQLHNLPEEAIYNWEPGAQLGIYRPDTFWFTPHQHLPPPEPPAPPARS
jgi:peptide/nickel transport system substrate-binding protein